MCPLPETDTLIVRTGSRGDTKKPAPGCETIDTVNLYFEAVGQGPPLIILHGLLGSADNWRSMSRHLGAHYKVFRRSAQPRSIPAQRDF
jgi:hypothetical protein